jgi:hypothetical protein
MTVIINCEFNNMYCTVIVMYLMVLQNNAVSAEEFGLLLLLLQCSWYVQNMLYVSIATWCSCLVFL